MPLRRLPVPPRPRAALVTALAVLALAPALALAAGGPVWVGVHPVRWTFARLGAPVPVSAALRVALDPETGRLGLPSAAQAAQLEAVRATSARPALEPLQAQQLPDGGWMVDLRGQFMSDVVVVKGSDGRVHFICTDQPQQRDRALAGATAPAPAALPEE